MKKNIKFILLLSLFTTISFFTGCEEGLEDLTSEFSSGVLFTPDRNFQNSDVSDVTTKIHIPFADVSQGLIKRDWILSEGGNFLREFTPADTTDLTPFIDATIGFVDDTDSIPGLRTNNDIVNVLFTEPSDNSTITYRGVFKDSTSLTFNGDKVSTVLNSDGTWVAVKEFGFRVFGDLKPTFRVTTLDGTELVRVAADEVPAIEDASTWPVVTIEAGTSLLFEDLTTGLDAREVNRQWSLPKGSPKTVSGEEAVASVKFNALGTFSVGGFIQSRTGVIEASAARLIPLVVEVIPSTQPFIIDGGVNIDSNQVISFTVTGEVASVANQAGNFVVHVTNTAAGFDENIPVKSVSVNSSDATVIELELTGPVYNTDEIEISFSGGNITSVDSRVLQDFGSLPIELDKGPSVLINSWASFESEGTNWKNGFVNGYWVGNSNDDGSGGQTETVWFRTTEKAADGVASLRFRFDFSKNMKLQGSDFSKPNGIPAGDYYVSYKIFLEAGNTMKAFRTVLQDPFISTLWDIESLPRGEWVEVSQVLSLASDVPSGKRFDIQINPSDNSGVTGEQTIYFDDLKWVPLESRP